MLFSGYQHHLRRLFHRHCTASAFGDPTTFGPPKLDACIGRGRTESNPTSIIQDVIPALHTLVLVNSLYVPPVAYNVVPSRFENPPSRLADTQDRALPIHRVGYSPSLTTAHSPIRYEAQKWTIPALHRDYSPRCAGGLDRVVSTRVRRFFHVPERGN